MKKFYIFSLFMLIFIIGNTYAPEQSKFGVVVSITCEDESLKNLIESNVKRELRALHDVEIVELWGDVYTYELTIVLLENERNGTKTGQLSIATMYMRKIPVRALEPYFSKPFPYDISADPNIHTDPNISLPFYGGNYNLRVNSHPRADVKNYAQSIVAQFDIEMLEPQRKKR